METAFIDGSMGEGGGQILRTSLALSCITGKHLHIENIRAARRKPGLAKQHLSCVRAACQICDGHAEGATLGSMVLDFRPGHIRGGDFSFDIGSAGSASLVVQTVLPALFSADKPSTVTVKGGTHNPWAPPFDFLRETFLPAIATAGFQADCRLIKHGFFPAGGGKISFTIQPRQATPNEPIDLCKPLEKPDVRTRIYTARLPAHIAHRQEKLLCQSGLRIKNFEHVDVTDSDGPGNCIMLRICGNHRTIVSTAFGAKGKPSEKVVREVVNLTQAFLSSSAAADRFLADQLLIYMATSKTGSYTTNDLSTHLTTNIETIKKFLPVNFNIEQQNQIHRISCEPE
ncbi:MAG: RNA 3'-phosphate cyclase [Planctomycetes bacterium B3_Pla]|nr:MAG: RNA 3'-phosphate cyclase [Planctomycetes bacterium B3_Pla]